MTTTSSQSPDLDSLLRWDREHLWHPYTSMTEPVPVQMVQSASGTRLHLADGREVVDGMSSWWSAIHGYRHPDLDAAAHAQVDRMSHVMFGGLTHEPAIRLGQELVSLAPDGLEHVFLADSGSVSVEVALKVALQWQRGRGRRGRTRFLTVRGGYHGDTCGCMGVCDPDGGMHGMWRGFLPEHVFAPRPPAPGGDVEGWAAEIRSVAADHVDELAAIVVEPILQGAGGMWVYDPACLRVMREVADELDLLLVLDEIATGFGRTGTLFASEAADVVPDVMCVGKSLTGGYLTMAAMLCTARVAHGLSRSEAGVLMHGPTFMGNPLASAVALASLQVLQRDGWQQQVQGVNDALVAGLTPLLELPQVVDVRCLGAVGVVQLDHAVDMPTATAAALGAGAWLRPFRDLVYTMPPYISSAQDVDTICRAVAAAVEVG